jgi:hypothetical protein
LTWIKRWSIRAATSGAQFEGFQSGVLDRVFALRGA